MRWVKREVNLTVHELSKRMHEMRQLTLFNKGSDQQAVG